MRNSYAIIAIVVVGVIVGGSVYGVMASVSSTVTTTVTSTAVSTVTVGPTQQTSTASSASTSPSQLTPVTIGSAVAFAVDYYLPILVAQDKGIWAQNGLDVTWQKFLGGPAESQAFASGQIGVGLTAAGASIDSYSRGVPMKIVADYEQRTSFGLIVNGSSSINSLTQLNGSTIAVTSTTGLEAVYAKIVAQKYNLTFNFVTTGSLPNSLALVASGKAVAIDYAETAVVDQLVSGQLRIVYNDSSILPTPWAEFVIAASNNMINNNPATLHKVVTAFSQTIQFIINNPAYSEQVIQNFSKSSPEVATQTYNMLVSSWIPSLAINPVALQNVQGIYVNYGITPSNIAANISSTYTTSFLP